MKRVLTALAVSLCALVSHGADIVPSLKGTTEVTDPLPRPEIRVIQSSSFYVYWSFTQNSAPFKLNTNDQVTLVYGPTNRAWTQSITGSVYGANQGLVKIPVSPLEVNTNGNFQFDILVANGDGAGTTNVLARTQGDLVLLARTGGGTTNTFPTIGTPVDLSGYTFINYPWSTGGSGSTNTNAVTTAFFNDGTGFTATVVGDVLTMTHPTNISYFTDDMNFGYVTNILYVSSPTSYISIADGVATIGYSTNAGVATVSWTNWVDQSLLNLQSWTNTTVPAITNLQSWTNTAVPILNGVNSFTNSMATWTNTTQTNLTDIGTIVGRLNTNLLDVTEIRVNGTNIFQIHLKSKYGDPTDFSSLMNTNSAGYNNYMPNRNGRLATIEDVQESTNAVNFLRTNTVFSGDVSGVYTNLQIGEDTVGLTEIDTDSLDTRYMTGMTNVFNIIMVGNQTNLGAELVSNGSFDGSSNWVLSGDCLYGDEQIYMFSNKSGSIAPSNDFLLPLQTGNIYKVSMNSSGGGTSIVSIGGSSWTTTNAGTRYVFLQAVNVSSNLNVQLLTGTAAMWIDDLSVKQVTSGVASVAGTLYVGTNLFVGGVPVVGLNIVDEHITNYVLQASNNIQTAAALQATAIAVAKTNVTDIMRYIRDMDPYAYNGMIGSNYVLSFDHSARTFTLTATDGGPIRYRVGGASYTRASPFTSSACGTNTGSWYWQISTNNVESVGQTPWSLYGVAQLAYAYKNADSWECIIYEGHKVEWPDSLHANQHLSVGAKWISGMTAMHNAGVAGAAASDGSNTCIGVLSSGRMMDEDLMHTINSVGTATGNDNINTSTCVRTPWMYPLPGDGFHANRSNAFNRFQFFHDGTQPYFVNATGGWQAVAEDNYWVTFAVAAPCISGTNYYIISGVTNYTTAAAVSNVTPYTIAGIYTNLPFNELIMPYRFIWQYNASVPAPNPAEVMYTKLISVTDYRQLSQGAIVGNAGSVTVPTTSTNGLASTNFVDSGYIRTNESRNVNLAGVRASSVYASNTAGTAAFMIECLGTGPADYFELRNSNILATTVYTPTNGGTLANESHVASAVSAATNALKADIGAAGVTALSNLTDVATIDMTEGQVLTWTDGMWSNKVVTATGGGDQTPWTNNIFGANFTLSNAVIQFTNSAGIPITVQGGSIGGSSGIALGFGGTNYWITFP